jgi:hypothetical protein
MNRRSWSIEFEWWALIIFLEIKSDISKSMSKTFSSSSWPNFIMPYRLFLIIWWGNQKFVQTYEQKVLVNGLWKMTFHFHFGNEKSFFKHIDETFSSPWRHNFIMLHRIFLIFLWDNQKLVKTYEEKVLINWFWIMTFDYHFENQKSLLKTN